VPLDASKEQSTVLRNSVNHALVTRQDAGKVLNEAKKEGTKIIVSPEHPVLQMSKEGKPFVALGTESPSIVVNGPDGKTRFVQ
jgi:hypothetical protein